MYQRKQVWLDQTLLPLSHQAREPVLVSGLVASLPSKILAKPKSASSNQSPSNNIFAGLMSQ